MNLFKKPNFKKYFLPFIFGAFGVLGFAPVNILICTIASVSWLYINLLKTGSYRDAFKISFTWGFGFNLALFYWLVFPLTLDAEEFAWLVPLALTIVPSVFALFYSTLLGLFNVVVTRLKCALLNPVMFATLWLMIEISLSTVPVINIPWGLVGYATSGSVFLIQLGSILGIFGTGFLLVFFSALCGECIIAKERRIKLVSLFLMIGLVIFSFGFGAIRLYIAGDTKFTDIKIGIIQGNIEQNLKWQEDQLYKNLDKYISITNQLPEDVKIIIWPESAVPFALYDDDTSLCQYLAFATKNMRLLITGGIRITKKNNNSQLFNSIFFISKNGKLLDCYDKRVLLPFGEYIPFKRFIPFKKITHGTQDYSFGKKMKSSVKNAGIIFLPVICYESIFPKLINLSTNASCYQVILSLANDGWFGNSSQPYHHLAICRFRCVESGVPLIRATNTGVSAVFDSYGRLINKIDINQTGFITLNIPQ